MQKIQEKLQAIADKTSSWRWLQVLSAAFAMIMPLQLIGSIFTLLEGMQITAWQNFIQSTGLAQALILPYNYTYGYISLYLVFAVTYQYCMKAGARKNAIHAGFFAIGAFLAVCPADTLSTWVGAQGMFMAMIIGFLVGNIYRICITKNVTIKLPESVPPMVANSFTAMIPGFFAMLLAFVIHFVFSLTSYGDAQTFIYSLMRWPLTFATSSMLGEMFVIGTGSLAWFFGIHGLMLISPLYSLFIPAMVENMTAYAQNLPIPNMYVGVPICASTVSTVIAVFLFMKHERARSVAKVSLIPAIFEIQEPILFGLPLCLNPYFLIPYCIQNFLWIFGTHVFQWIGFLPNCNCLSSPRCVPAIIGNVIKYGWQGGVVHILFTALSVLLFMPFMKMYDKHLFEEDAKKAEA